jgi:hypothetical protein
MSRTGFFAYIIILASCLAGAFHVSPWAIVASGCLLALLSILNNHEAISRRIGSGSLAQSTLMLSSLLNAGLTSIAAYGIGLGLGWALIGA